MKAFRKIAGKALAALAGLAFILLALEAFLRIIGYMHVKRAHSDEGAAETGRYTILCLGDSYTYGEGAAREKSYPRQLEALLNAGSEEKRASVVNRGQGGQNTAMLVKELQYNIETIRPADLIILLTGENNFWNYWGYGAYRNRGGFFSLLHDRLYRVRVFKLGKLLYNNLKFTLFGRKDADPASPVSVFDGLLLRRAFADSGRDPDAEIAGAIESLKMFPKRIKIHRRIAFLYKERGMYKEAEEWLLKAIALNPANVAVLKDLGDLMSRERRFRTTMYYYDQAFQLDPAGSGAACAKGQAYLWWGKPRDAIVWFKKGVELDPEDDECHRWLWKAYVDLAEREGPGVYAEAGEFFRVASRKNPEFQDLVLLLEKKDGVQLSILKWVYHDIETIVKICAENGVRMILLNYPVANDLTRSGMLEFVSAKHAIPFVDNFAAFNNILAAGGKWEDYFVPDNHCNERGYGEMAKGVFEKMRQERLFGLEPAEE